MRVRVTKIERGRERASSWEYHGISSDQALAKYIAEGKAPTHISLTEYDPNYSLFIEVLEEEEEPTK